MTTRRATAMRRKPWPYLGVLGILVLVPLPLGANRPWSWSVLAIAVSICLFGCARDALRLRGRWFIDRRLIVPASLAAILLAWILVGLIPGMPMAASGWSDAEATLGGPAIGYISIDPGAGWSNLLRLGSYLGMFWLVVQYGRKPSQAIEILRWIGLSAAAYSLYGIVDMARSAGRQAMEIEGVRSSFVNPNHFATYAALAALANGALFYLAFRHRWHQTAYLPNGVIRTLSSISGRAATYGVATVLCVMGLMQSHSRMGLVAFVISAMVSVGFMVRLGLVAPARRVVAVLAALLSVLLWVSGLHTLNRMMEVSEFDRGPIFGIAIDAIAAEPWTGYGYGTFATVAGMFRNGEFAQKDITEAHNVYLQLAVELGVPATLAWLFAVAWVISICFVGAIRRQRDQIFAVAAVGASAVVAVHSLADFGAQIPAVAIIFAAMLGLGVSQSTSNRAYYERQPERSAESGTSVA